MAILKQLYARARRSILGRNASSVDETARLRAVINGSSQGGWRDAVLAHVKDSPDLLRYVGDERAGDWRFLLPSMPEGKALCLGGALSPVPLTLARSCAEVTVKSAGVEKEFLQLRASQEELDNIKGAPGAWLTADGRRFDLVAALRPSPTGLTPRWAGLNMDQVAASVRRGGWLYLEVDRLALLAPPTLLRRRLRKLGFSEISLYWPKPTLSSCEVLIPLGDTRLQRYYVRYIFFAMSPLRKLLRQVLAGAVALRLFELTLPQYIAVARLGEAK